MENQNPGRTSNNRKKSALFLLKSLGFALRLSFLGIGGKAQWPTPSVH